MGVTVARTFAPARVYIARLVGTSVFDPLGDEVGFLCGHGPGGKIGDERRTNPYLRGL